MSVKKHHRTNLLERNVTLLNMKSPARSKMASRWEGPQWPCSKTQMKKITFSRTSDDVSRSNKRIWDTKSAIVNSFFHNGARSVATMARAALTFLLSSSVKAFTFFATCFATDIRGRFLFSSSPPPPIVVVTFYTLQLPQDSLQLSAPTPQSLVTFFHRLVPTNP